MPSTTNMQYVRLGESGLKVSKIILGCMSYGTPEWQKWVLSEEEAIQHIKFAYEAGINTFDTANIYSNGLSETILGNAIKKLSLPRDNLVIMTKIAGRVARTLQEPASAPNPDASGYVNQYGLSRKNIFQSVKQSLERLQLDYIDVLQCHRFDPNTPISETLQALHDVVKAGYVRYLGMSSCWAYQFHQMQNYAIVNNLTPFISMQNHYSMLYREEEREMVPTLKAFGVGMITWGPLARGVLARPFDEKNTTRANADKQSALRGIPAAKETIDRVEELAAKKGITMAQVSLAWVMAKDGVTAPIVGTTSLDSLKDLIAAVDVKLTEEEIKYLEEPYQPQAVIGH